jgi:hypothetical protein
VGGRFHLDARAMPLSVLRFWYEGHVAMAEEEAAEVEKAKAAAGGR